MILRDILDAPRPRALLLARNCNRAMAASCARALAAESYAQRYRDTRRGAELGDLAILAGRRSEDMAVLADALMYAGNAFRLIARYQAAKRALAEAASLPLDPAQYQRLLSFQASLAEALRDWPRFHALCVEGLDLAQTPSERASCLIQLAIALGALDLPDAAIAAAAEAVDLTVPDTSAGRALLRQAAQTLCWWLQEADYPERALDLLRGLRHAFDVEADPLEPPKLLWLEGRVHFKLGARSAGLRFLVEARDIYLALGQPVHAAILQIDMAFLETLAGEPERSITLCRECLPILEMAGLKRDSTAARLLMRAARQRQPKQLRSASEAIVTACARARSRQPVA